VTSGHLRKAPEPISPEFAHVWIEGQNSRPQENPMPRFETLAKTLATLILLCSVGISAEAQFNRGQLLRQIPGRSHDRSLPAGVRAGGVGSNPFQLIDYPGGIANQYPTSINDKGKIVGIVGLPDGSFQGYELQGTNFKLISYPGAPSTGVLAINKSGVIVGIYCDDIECDSGFGFELKGKNFTSIEYPGGMNTEPMGINAAGDVVGTYQSPDGKLHGFLLHKGAYTTIDFPNSYQTVPYSINQQGIIVGGYVNSDGSGGGFMLQGGTFTQINYPGTVAGEVDGINDSGDMVGFYANPGETSNHGYLLSGGVFTSFDVPFPGSISTVPSGLNNKHQIVGSYGSYPPDYFFGFLTTY
jgi:hypothetical protein